MFHSFQPSGLNINSFVLSFILFCSFEGFEGFGGFEGFEGFEDFEGFEGFEGFKCFEGFEDFDYLPSCLLSNEPYIDTVFKKLSI